MVQLSDVVSLPGLNLRPEGELLQPTARVRWAHVTELADPTPWLLGEEFLLTTGLALSGEPEEWEQYCSRLASAGVTALGISTGPTLPHRRIPDGLVESARRHRLDLIHIPERTLLQAVVQQVSQAIHAKQSAPLVSTLAAQRELSAAAAGSGGVTAVLSKLVSTAGLHAVVLDERLRTVAASDRDTEELLSSLKDDLRNQLSLGVRWSMTTEEGLQSVVAMPLGTQGRLRGVLTVRRAGSLDAEHRALLATAVSLLSLLLEVRHARQGQERTLYRRALVALLATDTTAADVTQRLRESGIDAGRYQVLVVSAGMHLEKITALVAFLSEHCADVLVHDGGEETVLLLCEPAGTIPGILGTALEGTGGAPAGLGRVGDSGQLKISLRQARFARTTAAARGVPHLDRADIGAYQVLLSLGGDRERREYADMVLGDLEENDPRGELYATLTAFVASGGSIENTADKVLVHRHTVRSRLQRIAELTGRDSSRAPDLYELWLATEVREMGAAMGGGDSPAS